MHTRSAQGLSKVCTRSAQNNNFMFENEIIFCVRVGWVVDALGKLYRRRRHRGWEYHKYFRVCFVNCKTTNCICLFRKMKL